MTQTSTVATGPALDSGSVGLWTGALDGRPPAEAGELVAELDEQGWGSLWFGEAVGRDAMVAAQWYLAHSRRMSIGTGIANIYARDAQSAAAGARTLHAAYDGRFVLGLGVSHLPLVERMRGHRYGKPVAMMREYLDALAAAPAIVAGEQAMPPVVLAALGPRMLQLASERTQGAHPYLTTPEHTAEARRILGGTREDGPLLLVEQAVVVDPAADTDEEVWRTRAHEHLNIYTGLPNYRNNWLRLGFGEEDLVRGGSERLARALVSRGVEAARASVQAHLRAGASAVLIQVLGPTVVDPPREDWRRLAEALFD